jgi:hypothetical protein
MTFSWTDFSFQPFTVSAFRFVPVEQSVLALLLVGGDSDQAPNEPGTNRKPSLSRL